MVQVQHAPYSGDGGALDSRYQLSCLQLFLRTSEQASTHYDLILWNTGIHDGASQRGTGKRGLEEWRIWRASAFRGGGRLGNVDRPAP